MQQEHKQDNPRIHYYSQPVSSIRLPEKFTNPFYYTPHPLCLLAAEEVQTYLQEQKEWQTELQKGKMFGVLAVRTTNDEIAYLAAFSGLLAGQTLHSFFVPPIYDVQHPQSFFRKEEEQISAINTQIQYLESNETYIYCREKQAKLIQQAQQALSDKKVEMKKAKALRDQARQRMLSFAESRQLIRESQYQKAEYKRLEKYWKEQIALLSTEIARFSQEIENLRTERKNRSATLQQKLFAQFLLLNGRHETKDLCQIFEETTQRIPPAGAGECAAPKLLQYAYQNHLHPLAMAEFWWGESPKSEIRRHGCFYPSCRSKCEPILNFMLQGLEVEENPLQSAGPPEEALEVLYEDPWLAVVNKPAGMLSVPGKSRRISVTQIVQKLFPKATGPLLVHRLDMATSGLLLIAKTREVHRQLQSQFEKRSIQKRYVALLDGIIPAQAGSIDLPLCPDLTDRPRQIVSYEYGKTALTRYEVLQSDGKQTLVAFYPLTGRTHQLRVHAAHPLGLNTPIAGDELYGRKAGRLYLHAESLKFCHPITGKTLFIQKKAGFG